MTNYERFREKLKKRIQEFLGLEVVIEYSDVRKNNGSHYEGLYMMGPEDQMFPILNIRDYYHYYLEQNRNIPVKEQRSLILATPTSQMWTRRYPVCQTWQRCSKTWEFF